MTSRLLLVVLLLALAGCTADEEPPSAPPASSAPGGGAAGGLTVLTQNLYLGASLPVQPPASPAALVATTARAYAGMLATDAPRRLSALADTIEREQPDLVGLQEVSRWTVRGSAADSSPPSVDFLALLRDALIDRGLDYTVAAVSENAEIGPVPLFAPAAGCRLPVTDEVPGCTLTIQDRDVVLLSERTPRLRLAGSGTGEYAVQQAFPIPGGGSATPQRGWAFADVVHRGKRLRFVTTHLEVKAFADTQRAQALQLLSGAAGVRGRVVLAGDLNSAADPETTDTPTATYADLVAGGFRDAWAVNEGDPGATCCQGSGLDERGSGLTSRIDVVLVRGRVTPLSAHLVCDVPLEGASEPPYWVSDHAGVVAVLGLR